MANPVPSDALVDLKRNAEDLDKALNFTSNFQNRVGNTLVPVPSALAQISSAVTQALSSIQLDTDVVSAKSEQSISLMDGYFDAAENAKNAALQDIQSDVDEVEKVKQQAITADIPSKINELGLKYPPTAYSNGLTLNDYTQTYSYNGSIYLWGGVLGTVTTGAFDEGDWQPLQGDLQLRVDIAEFNSISDLILNSYEYGEGHIAKILGEQASQWKATATTGLTPSQTPVERGAPELVDGSGRLWLFVVDGPIVQLSKLGVSADGTDCTNLINGLGSYYIDISGLEGVYITNQITVKGLKGNTVNDSYFSVDDNFNLAAGAVIRLNSNESSGIVGGVGVVMEQPNVSTRAECIQYPWALDFQSLSRIAIDKFRCSGAWNGVNATGNTGGAKIDTLEVGALNEGLWVDGALDFWHATTLHFWPFGITGLLNLYENVYSDSTTVGAKIEDCDGLDVKALNVFRCSVKIGGSISPLPFGNIGSLQLDGKYGRLDFSSGSVSIGGIYGASNEPDDYLIKVSGGNLTAKLNTLTPSVGFTQPSIAITGGNSSFYGGVFRVSEQDISNIEITGGISSFTDLKFVAGASLNRTVGFIKQSGGFLTISKPEFPNSGGANGDAITKTSGVSTFDIPRLYGWGYSIPQAFGDSYYNIPDKVSVDAQVSFAVNGDFSPTYANRTCLYAIRNNVIDYRIDLNFNSNAYTTASGVFNISTNIPYLSGYSLQSSIIEIARFSFTDNLIALDVSNNTINIRRNNAGSDTGNFTIANVPASTSGLRLKLAGSYSPS